MARFRIIATVHLVLEKDGKYLMIRRQNTGFADGQYSLVAGHLDGNESVRSAMAREANEEAGILVKEGDLEVVHVVNRRSDDERIDFFLKAKFWEGQPFIKEPHKCDMMGWFARDSLPQDTVPYVRYALKQVEAGKFYSELGW